MLGIVGQVSPAQLKRPRYNGLRPGEVIGQSGVEHAYDRYLRGAGRAQVQVDALGRPKGELGNRPASAGSNLRLSLDAALQATGEAALRASGRPSAFVAMNARTGAVLAMGSTHLRPRLLREAAHPGPSTEPWRVGAMPCC